MPANIAATEALIALSIAGGENCLDVVAVDRQLTLGADPSARHDGETLLQVALRRGDVTTFNRLVRKGATVDDTVADSVSHEDILDNFGDWTVSATAWKFAVGAPREAQIAEELAEFCRHIRTTKFARELAGEPRFLSFVAEYGDTLNTPAFEALGVDFKSAVTLQQALDGESDILALHSIVQGASADARYFCPALEGGASLVECVAHIPLLATLELLCADARVLDTTRELPIEDLDPAVAAILQRAWREKTEAAASSAVSRRHRQQQTL